MTYQAGIFRCKGKTGRSWQVPMLYACTNGTTHFPTLTLDSWSEGTKWVFHAVSWSFLAVGSLSPPPCSGIVKITAHHGYVSFNPTAS